MNSKQMVILIVVAALMWSLWHGDGMAAGHNPGQYHPVSCGDAPGDVGILERLAWGMCESNEAVKQDTALGK